MRRRTTAVVLLAASLALAGCGSKGASKPEAKPSPSATQTADPDVVFMSAVEDAQLESYATGIPPWQDLTAFPPKWCAALDEGHSVQWMFGKGGLYPIGLDWGTKKPDANELLILGVKTYCPKRLSTVTKELRASGDY